MVDDVSTHSRAEAAAPNPCAENPALVPFQHTAARRRLPDELALSTTVLVFQHTAARRRLQKIKLGQCKVTEVSTHSRAEAAAEKGRIAQRQYQRFNTQPRGGGCVLLVLVVIFLGYVSTHSRAEAAAKYPPGACIIPPPVSTHSRAEAAAPRVLPSISRKRVSTHSRAEAAAPYIKKQEKSAN